MWSEDIDKKIQQADGSYNPAYNEKAWENMELLLDTLLPLKKKRRRFIFLLVPILLTGTTIFFILQKKDKNNNSIIEQKNIPVQSSSSPDKLPDNRFSRTIPSKRSSTPINPIKATTETLLPDTRSKNQLTEFIPGKKDKQNQHRQEYEQSQFFLEKMSVKKTEDPDNDLLRNNPVANNTIRNNNTAITFATDSLVTQKTIDPEEKKQEPTTQTETTKTIIKEEKRKIPAGSKFSLNLSFGPDISSVGIDKPGKLNMQYGIGVSYALSKRFRIRTGFFAGYKKYTADSADYHSPNTITNLQMIEANCFVYEVPLTLVYNFPVTKKHNWFISGGLSSYLMKKETYEYYYKNSWGQPQYYRHTYRNENSHLFSVINLSGGYQYHFSDRFSIMTEPYVKIPASGIGVGKVKLNSAGILFTIGFKPFSK
jgi:hypothetical protein